MISVLIDQLIMIIDKLFLNNYMQILTKAIEINRNASPFDTHIVYEYESTCTFSFIKFAVAKTSSDSKSN